MAAPSTPTSTDAPLQSKETDPVAKPDAEATRQLREERFAKLKKTYEKHHAMFKIPTMTSEELVAMWKQIDLAADERDDSSNSDEDDESFPSTKLQEETSPLLLIDVRSKAERAVSMLQGALAMEDPETTKWMNKYVHKFEGKPMGGIPTIVTYCTIGHRSGREAQHLADELTKFFGIEIGKDVQIKNLDGILAYSFVEGAPPLLRPCHRGSSDSFMTRRIHCYGKDFAEMVDPSFDTVYFDSKFKFAKQLVQTGLFSGVRMFQHRLNKVTSKAQKATVKKLSDPTPRRITTYGFTTNESAHLSE